MSFKNQIFRLLIILWITFLCGNQLYSQSKSININNLQHSKIKDFKPTIYFIHTDWCNYCKLMLKTTFKNKNVDNLLQEKVHFVEINAEEKLPILFKNKTYFFEPHGYQVGQHQILEALGIPKGTNSFPIILIKNSNNETIFQHSGFINAKDFLRILENL